MFRLVKSKLLLITVTLISLPVLYLALDFVLFYFDYEPYACSGEYMTVECLTEKPEKIMGWGNDFRKINFLMEKLKSETCDTGQSAKILGVTDDYLNCTHCTEELVESLAYVSANNPKCFLEALHKLRKSRDTIEKFMNIELSAADHSICSKLKDQSISLEQQESFSEFCQ